jgi:aminotransferase
MNLNFSDRAKNLKQSGIRNASIACSKLGGINLGQGVCQMPVPEIFQQSAQKAILQGRSLYSACEGIHDLRVVLTEKIQKYNKIPCSPEQIVITHGSTGAFVCTAMSWFNPGDEVLLFEPFYGYHKNILNLLGITTNTVAIHLEDLSIDLDELRKKISTKTKGLVLCTPNNPTGKVYSLKELTEIGRICSEFNLKVITDEIYEYITYENHIHISPASLPEFKQRTITISGFSKTYNMTGWRLGYLVCQDPELAHKISLVNDLLYVCPTTPLQYAMTALTNMPLSYFSDMQASYLQKRNFMAQELQKIGFEVTLPQGAYYMMCNFSNLPFEDDLHAVNFLLEKAKVACVTGRSFYQNPEDGYKKLRFCFALDYEVIEKALKQIEKALQTL